MNRRPYLVQYMGRRDPSFTDYKPICRTGRQQKNICTCTDNICWPRRKEEITDPVQSIAAEFTPNVLDWITSDAISLDLSKAKEISPKISEWTESPRGPVDILAGIDLLCEAPREYK
jgi:hypothetical protein